MGARAWAGKRVVIVGASSGIGRAFAVRVAKEGATAVFAARREDMLNEVVAEAGGGTAVIADIRQPADCARIVDTAKETLGEIDLLFVSVGFAPLRMFADTTAEVWRDVLDTNVIGVHQVIRACLPALAPSAMVAALSSEDVGQPRHGMGAYSSSKAALAETFNAWRLEHPRIRFSCIAVGPTVPTEFSSAYDPDLLDTLLKDWLARARIPITIMPTDEVADVLAGVLASAAEFPKVCIDELVVRPPSDARHKRHVE